MFEYLDSDSPIISLLNVSAIPDEGDGDGGTAGGDQGGDQLAIEDLTERSVKAWLSCIYSNFTTDFI